MGCAHSQQRASKITERSMNEDNKDFWRVGTVILTGGIGDLNSKKKIKKYNFDNPDCVVRIFKKIIKK